MQSTRPVPPKERKPIPSWSLLRRHSLIVPRNRLPLNRTERIKVNVPCHVSTVERTQQLMESTQTELREDPLVLTRGECFRPKLLHFPPEACIKADSHEKYEYNTSLRLLKLHTDSHKHGPELIRVPTNFTFSSETMSRLKSKLQSVVPLESFPMLWLPNVTDHVHHSSHPTKVELLSVQQLASLHPKPHFVDTVRKPMFTEPVPLISVSASAPQFLEPTKLLTFSRDFCPDRQVNLASVPRLIPLDSNFTTYCRTHETRGIGHESSRRSFPLLEAASALPKFPVSPVDEAAMSDMQKQAQIADNEPERESSSHTDLSVMDAYPDVEANEVRPVHFIQKRVVTTRSQDIGTQFDFIGDSLDAFIFNDNNLNVSNGEKDELKSKQVIDALSVTNDIVRNRPSSARRLPSKPVRKDALARSEVEHSVVHRSVPPRDLKSQNRPRASSASLFRKRDLARTQRRSTFSARRCDETIKFVDKVLSECVVMGTPVAPSVGNKPPKHNSRCDQSASRGTEIRTSGNVSGRKTLPATQKISTGLAKSPNSRRLGQGLHTQQLYRGHPSHIVGRKQSQPMGSSTLALQSDEEDQQTTILSDWSVGSNVKRILSRNDQLICPISSCPSPVFSGSETATKSTVKDSRPPVTPRSIDESDQHTEDAAHNIGFIDWDEVDELLREN
ncbi:hypothetical protein AHF37_04542 [Paragonimus kellicotti]|nr:hypothetical protein AHF37_04542 [Paragonimus kellicotti]